MRAQDLLNSCRKPDTDRCNLKWGTVPMCGFILVEIIAKGLSLFLTNTLMVFVLRHQNLS